MTNLLGLHDLGGESLMSSSPGHVVHAVNVRETSHWDYSQYQAHGFKIICRLNWGWYGDGTIPDPSLYGQFASLCNSYVHNSPGCLIYIVGNEFNKIEEGPNGKQITEEQGAQCHKLCYEAIKTANSNVKVLVAAMAPWDARYKDWLVYQGNLVRLIGSYCDGYALHAYTHGADPNLIFSQEIQHGWYWHFKTYQQQIESIIYYYPDAEGKEFHITESNQGDEAWVDTNSGWIQNAAEDVDSFNRHSQGEIKSLSFYRFKHYPNDRWGMEGKNQLLADFTSAVGKNYQSPEVSSSADSSSQYLPFVSSGDQGSVAPAPDLHWDPRLTDRGVKILPVEGLEAGDVYWRVRYGQWLSESEAGGRHHIYVSAFDRGSSQPIPDLPFDVVWPDLQGSDGHVTEYTKNGTGINGGNYPMSGSLNDYSTWMGIGYPSEIVTGIGMGADGNKNVHTSTILEFEKYVYQGSSTPPEAPSYNPPPVTYPMPVSGLTHPVKNPSLRGLSQYYGENEEVYRQYKIDGVPLHGHEGLDFLTPVGSEILSVDSGRVVEAADQGNKGYGKYVKVAHDWGETVYAHLNQIAVKVGDQVVPGHLLGFSGNTGNTTGPHLHFGMRVKPFDRRDGMGGYVDPLPYLYSGNSSSTPPKPPPPDSGSVPADPVPGTQDLLNLVRGAAKEFGVDWKILASLIHAESSFNPKAWNESTDAFGLGQITEMAEKDIQAAIGPINISDPKDNIRGTAWYLAWCIKQMGSVRMGLWAYQMGVQAVRDSDNVLPMEVLNYASKIIHGKEMLDLVGA